MLSELGRRYKEHEMYVIIAKSQLDNLVGIKAKFMVCPQAVQYKTGKNDCLFNVTTDDVRSKKISTDNDMF